MPARAPLGLSCLLGGSLLALGALGDVVLLRSFEFLPVPRSLAPFTPPTPPPTGEVAPVDSRGAPSAGVTILFTDGMRLDSSRQLPAFEGLRQEGVSVVTRCLFPTFTRNGQATIQTGAGPRVHGYMANYNRRRARVTSLGDHARAAGIHTRFFAEALFEPYMFPEATVERAVLDPVLVGQGPRPHLTLVYLHQPDATAHREGGSSRAYREAASAVDQTLAAIRSQLDLQRETLVVVTDHGHLDQGGHGGHEEVVYRIPLILAGAGVKSGIELGVEIDSDLRDVAPTVALLLGITPPPHATGRPLYEALANPPPPAERIERGPRHPPDPVWALGLRLVLGLLPGGILFGLCLMRGTRARLVGSALLGPAVFLLLYALRGYPFSYSCVNREADVPMFMLEVLILAILGAVVSAISSRDRRWAPALAGLALAWAGGLSVSCGWGAPLGLAYPRLAFHAHLALIFCLAAGLVIPIAGLARWALRTRGESPPPPPSPRA